MDLLSSKGAAFAPSATALLETTRYWAEAIGAVVTRSITVAVNAVSDSAMLSVRES